MSNTVSLHNIEVMISLNLAIKYTEEASNLRKHKSRESLLGLTRQTVPNRLHTLACRTSFRIELDQNLFYISIFHTTTVPCDSIYSLKLA